MKVEFELDEKNSKLLIEAYNYHKKIKSKDSKIKTNKQFVKELFLDSLFDYTNDFMTNNKF